MSKTKKSKKGGKKVKEQRVETPTIAEEPTALRPTPPRGPGLDLSKVTNSTPDVRDLDRELRFCLEQPNPRDAECVRLLVGHVVSNNLQVLEQKSHLGEANKALLGDAIATLRRLIA